MVPVSIWHEWGADIRQFRVMFQFRNGDIVTVKEYDCEEDADIAVAYWNLRRDQSVDNFEAAQSFFGKWY